MIIGTRTAEQLGDNLEAAELELSSEELHRLDEVAQPNWGYPYDFIGRFEPW